MNVRESLQALRRQAERHISDLGMGRDVPRVEDITDLIEQLDACRQLLEGQGQDGRPCNENAPRDGMYAQAFLSAPWPVMLLRQDGRIVDANQAAAQLLGVAMYEWSRADCSLFELGLQRSYQDQLRTNLKEIVSSGSSRNFELCFVQVSSGSSAVLTYIVRGVPGHFACQGEVFLFLRDVTESREVENALYERESVLRTVLGGLREGYLMLTETGTIIDVNPAYCAMSGYRREELLHMHMGSLFAELDLVASAQLMHRMSAARQPEEALHRHKSGLFYPVGMVALRLPVGKRGYVCLCQDLSVHAANNYFRCL